MDLEQAVSHLEIISKQLHTQALEFYPGEEFATLDRENVEVLEAISDIKRSLDLIRINNGLTDLEHQKHRLETRQQQLEDFFMETSDDFLNNSLMSLHSDIMQTKKELHIKRHQEVNIVLNETTNKLLERYQLI